MKLNVFINLATYSFYFNPALSLDLRGRGIPVPHAEELDRMLNKFMNFTEFDDAVFRYLFGIESDSINGTDSENLDISILDAEAITKIVSKAQKRFQDNQKHDARRYYKDERYVSDNKLQFIEKTLDMMVQSIYMANLRMRDTKPYRDKYRNLIGYNMAIMFGALMSIRTKMEELYAVMHKFKKRTHFLWYLVIYEKILAFHVDVTNMCEKIFQMHEERSSKKWDTANDEEVMKEGNLPNFDGMAEKFNIDISDPKNLALLQQHQADY